MTRRKRDLAKWGTDAVTARRAEPVGPARSGTVVHRVVPAHLACRIGERGQEAPAQPQGAVSGAETGH